MERACNAMSGPLYPNTVRESPPPTPREAYLPQRPERTQEEGGIRAKIDLTPSRSGDSQDKAETQSNQVNSAPGWLREEQDQEAPLKKEAESGNDPKSLTRLRNTTSVYPVYIDYQSVAVPRTDQRMDQPY